MADKPTVVPLRPSINPDYGAAEHFLTLLHEGAEALVFQTFDDSRQKRAHLTKILIGTLDEHWDDLCKLSAHGAGVYVTVQNTDGTGRKRENIREVRALFQECDRQGTPEPKLEPHIVVETSPGKSHRYFLHEPHDNFARWSAVQQRLVDDFGSDPCAKDTSRVLRIPGFPHQKDPNNPHMVTVTHESGRQPYAWNEITAVIKPVRDHNRDDAVEIPPGTELKEPLKVASALAALNADLPYANWLNAGFALSHESGGGLDGFKAWDEWSQKSNSYRPGETASRWRTMGRRREAQVTIRTLYKMASDAGWRWHDKSQQSPTTDARPLVQCLPGKLPEMADSSERILLQHGGIYQRGGVLVRAVRKATETVRTIKRPENTLLIDLIERDALLDSLNRSARFERFCKSDEQWVACDCPTRIASAVLSRKGQWLFPSLVNTISTPTLRPDGSILDKPGYDSETGLLLYSDTQFPVIPDKPDKDGAIAALATLNDVIKDFAFADDYGKSVMLAAILTSLIRRSLKSAPITGISAPKPASGKSLTGDIIAMIATGNTATVMSYTADPEELRKRITSVLMAGDLVVNIDNIEGNFKSSALCSVLTQETYADRLLATNKMVTVPTCLSWVATGNNLTIEGDLTTRTLLCQLDPQCERPEEREFDRDLYEWIPANRQALVVAGLTVLRAYAVAGMPKQQIKPFGRFEHWSDWVRSALVWLDAPDPLVSREGIEDGDPVRAKLRELLLAWHSAFGTAEATVKEAVFRANETSIDDTGNQCHTNQALYDVLTEHFPGDKGAISSQKLGCFLRDHLRRIEIGARFEIAESYGTRQLWRAVIVDNPAFTDALANFRKNQSTVWRVI